MSDAMTATHGVIRGPGYFGDVFTFTGGQSVPSSPSMVSATCQDWTSNSSTLRAAYGDANESYVWFWTGGGGSCAGEAPSIACSSDEAGSDWTARLLGKSP
jgi:hypothetical protein